MTVKHLRELLAAIPLTEDHRELVIWLPNREPGNGIALSLHGEPERWKEAFFIEASVSIQQ